MKAKIKICLAIILLATLNLSLVFGQMMPYGESGYIPEDPDYQVPFMVADPYSQTLTLPNEVDNSTQIYFPKSDGSTTENSLYDQGPTGSCVFASTIYYQFTYEINRLRNLPANSLSRRYMPNAGYNYFNGGSYTTGSNLGVCYDYLTQHGAVSEVDWGNRDPLDYLR